MRVILREHVLIKYLAGKSVGIDRSTLTEITQYNSETTIA